MKDPLLSNTALLEDPCEREAQDALERALHREAMEVLSQDEERACVAPYARSRANEDGVSLNPRAKQCPYCGKWHTAYTEQVQPSGCGMFEPLVFHKCCKCGVSHRRI